MNINQTFFFFILQINYIIEKFPVQAVLLTTESAREDESYLTAYSYHIPVMLTHAFPYVQAPKGYIGLNFFFFF